MERIMMVGDSESIKN